MTRIPDGLSAAGERLYRSLSDQFDLEEHEAVLLLQAARTADLCEQLQELLDRDGPLLGTRAHPAAVELRQQRLVLARLLVALRVPEGDGESATRPQRRGVRGVYQGAA